MKQTYLLLSLVSALMVRAAGGQEVLFGPKQYTRTTGKPVTYSDGFNFAGEHSEGKLTVANGNVGGENRVSSATIILNGRQLFGPSDFNQKVGSLEAFVPLEDVNTLSVELAGKPGGFLTVEVTHPFFEEVPGWRMPESAVTNLTVSPERVDPGQAVTLSATVANVGTADTPAATVAFLVEGVEVARTSVPALAPREETIVSATWEAAGPGRHVVQADLKVEPGESDASPSNNVRFAWARVSGEAFPQPEIEFGAIDFPALQVSGNTDSIVPVRVRNPGFATVAPSLARVFMDDQLVHVEPLDALGPGEEVEIQVPWDSVTPGQHALRAEVHLPAGPDQSDGPVFATVWNVIIAGETLLYAEPLKNKWASVGPRILDNGWVGRVRFITFDPGDPDVLYVGAAANDMGIPAGTGVWRSGDAGGTWQPIGDKLPSMLVTSAAVDPMDSQIIYVGTAEGIFKTHDGGSVWWYFAGPEIAKGVSRLFVRRPSAGHVLIYAGTSTGVLRYKSDNPIAEFSDASEWDNIRKGDVGDLVVHPTNSSILYTFVKTDGIYRTTVGEIAMAESASGAHDWTKLTAGLPNVSNKSVTLDIHKIYPNLVYAGITQPQLGLVFGIYRSGDGGDLWTTLKTYAAGDLDDDKYCPIYNPYIRVVPKPLSGTVLQEIIYFGGNCLYQLVRSSVMFPGIPGAALSATYMVTGYYVKQQAGVDLKALEFLPNPAFRDTTYYSVGDQGVFKCFIDTTPKQAQLPGKLYGESGDLCFPRNNDLRVTEFYDIDVSASNPNLIIGGTQDTGTVLYSGDTTGKWKMINGGDGNYSLIHPASDQIMYSQHQDLVDTVRSTDGGLTWPKGVVGAPSAYGPLGYIAAQPWDPNAVVATPGTSLAYSLTYFPPPLDMVFAVPFAPAGTCTGNPSRVAFSTSLPGWFIGTDKGRICYAAKGSSTFTEVFSHPLSVPIEKLSVSPAAPNRLYATFRASGLNKERIYTVQVNVANLQLSTSSDISAGFPFPQNLTPLAILGDPYEEEQVYVGTEKGVWTRPVGGLGNVNQWQPYSDGLPLTTVVDLVAAPDKTILAATKGRGVWRVVTGP
jgi:hypothetical protein